MRESDRRAALRVVAEVEALHIGEDVRARIEEIRGLLEAAKARPMRQVSKKQSAILTDRTAALRVVFARDGHRCMLGPHIATVDAAHDCHQLAECGHEPLKRSAVGGGTYRAVMTKAPYIAAACVPCNGWVEDHPADARRLGLSLPREATLDDVRRCVSKIGRGVN